MGDVIEFTTRLKCDVVFYKINAGAVLFSIKGDSNAVVGIAEEPHPFCVYWIYIGCHNYTWLQKNNKNYCRIDTHDILSRDEYRDFWLAWNNGKIRFGCKDETNPLISKKISEKNLCYITFISNMPRIDLQWKCLLPPQIEKPLIVKLSGSEPQWISATDQLPDDALIGGYENETLYIIRAPHSGSLTPGKFVPSEGVGYISWGGTAHAKSEFEVLCGHNCVWQKTYKNTIPVGAVEAGYSEDYERGKLYVGRVEHDGHLIPGKVQPSHKVCYIPYCGQEITKKNYEILVVPYANTRSACNDFIMDVDLNDSSNAVDTDSDLEDE